MASVYRVKQHVIHEFSGNNETKIAEATTHPLVTLLILFGLPFGVLFVVVPSLTVIIIILKNRKLKEIYNNIF